MRVARTIVPMLAAILVLAASSSVWAQVAPRSRAALPRESATTVQPGATLTTVGDAAAPADVRPTTVTATRITLAWSAVPGASGYTVARVQNPTGSDYYRDLTATPLSQPMFADAGLLPGTTYGYQVKALRSDGHHGTSVPVRVTTLAPVNPTNFTGTANASDITLRWDPVPDAAFYYLQGDGLVAQKVAATSYTVRGVKPGTYNYALVAYYGPAGQEVANESAPARTSVVLKAARGRYRITINGFKVDRETLDNEFGSDGKGDEVYVAAYVREYNRTDGSLLRQAAVRSDQHGDVSGYEGRRVRAGTASQSGGILRGNAVPNVPNPAAPNGEPTPNTFPLLVWEGELVEGETAVLVTPAIWEWDDQQAQYDDWLSLKQRSLESPLGLEVFQARLRDQSLTPGELSDNRLYDASPTSGDRPVGLGEVHSPNVGRYLRPFVQPSVLVTREAVESALAASSQSGQLPRGGVAIRYQDVGIVLSWAGWQLLGGDYTLYLQAERAQ